MGIFLLTAYIAEWNTAPRLRNIFGTNFVTNQNSFVVFCSHGVLMNLCSGTTVFHRVHDMDIQ